MEEIGKYKGTEDGFQQFKTIESNIVELIIEINSLRSTVRRKDEEARKNIKNLLLGLIEVVDAFDRVLKNIESKESIMDKQMKIWMGNFRSIRKQFEIVLQEARVEPMESMNQKAVPGFHTVMDIREMEGIEDDTIIEEIKKGYCWNEEVLRKAEVIVVKK